MRILLVEDDLRTAKFIVDGLEGNGFHVDHAENGAVGLDYCTASEYDLAIVDVMLPHMDGLSLVKTLREGDATMPVLFLSAKTGVDDKVAGLNVGGDDYLAKPFAFAELQARIAALLRRRTGEQESSEMDIGDLHINLQSRKVTRAGEPIELQPREFDLLAYLARYKDKVVSRAMIIENVWNFNFDPMSNVVESRICYLREKVDKGHEQKLIRTVRGAGYMLSDQD